MGTLWITKLAKGLETYERAFASIVPFRPDLVQIPQRECVSLHSFASQMVARYNAGVAGWPLSKQVGEGRCSRFTSI